ncbi:hypothetical protein BVG16_21035 [Paenibacillus selenitireducens]|uniref:Uncharacterized protein n=1 Tax=Paenibacillus selenitireducens TaxID=1324314 RepID=A0A1T2X5F3_9BACL|nr:hypothetical protein BVG16_21035 [Paenibacillus selenitireducens]
MIMSKETSLELIKESFDIIIQVLEIMKSNPEEGLLRQPYLNLPPLTNSALNNNSRVLEIMIQMLHHLPGHTAQIIYIAKMRKGQLEWKYN